MSFMSVGALTKLTDGSPATATIGEVKPYRRAADTARVLPPAGADIEADIRIYEDKTKELGDRVMAAGRLGRTKDERAIDSFIRALRNHRDQRAIRKMAVECLGRSECQ